jgi:acylglycerol lipase
MKIVSFKQFVYALSLVIAACFMLSGCSTAKTQPNSGIKQTPVLSKTAFFSDDGYRLPITRFWPATLPDGIVVALHGFNDYSKAFDGMCQYFLLKNLACIAYDQRGFGGTESIGLWPEKGRLQRDLYLLVRQIRQQHPQQPIFLVGESMGGAVIMTTMADARFSLAEEVDGTLLYAPAVWARSTQPWYQQVSLWLAVHTFAGWKLTAKSLGIQATDNINALRAMGQDDKVIKATRIDTLYGLTNLMDAALLASKDVSVRTLVLYGDKDEVIPKRPMCKMLEVMRLVNEHVAFINYTEGYHMLSRDLQAERVFNDSYEWIINGTVERNSFKFITLGKDELISYCGES